MKDESHFRVGDLATMLRAVQARTEPILQRRIFMSSAALAAATTAEAAKPEADKRADLKILDVFGRTASVRVDAEAWIDYMHLAQVEGRWCIVNVLWEMRG